MHQLPKVPSEEIQSRIHTFQQLLATKNIDGALVTQHVDLYYFTGTRQNGVCFIPQTGDPLFFVKKSVARAQFESTIPIIPLRKSKQLKETIDHQFGSLRRLGMELDVLPYGQALRYLRLWPDAEPVDLSFDLRLQRAIKSKYELYQLMEAAKKVNQVIESLPTVIRPGLTELELIATIEQTLRLLGNSNQYRMRSYNQELVLGMVASGSAAATPTFFDGPAGGIGLSLAHPQGSSNKEIKQNEPILIDIGTICEGYVIDQTRMAVIGEVTDEDAYAYQVAKQILREVERFARPGIAWEQVYEKAVDIVSEAGLRKHFMGFGDDQAHFLGHGVGLELDELPILAKGFSQSLVEGMVIAIEPKFTFPDRGVIGLENTYVVEADGLRAITLSSEDWICV